MISRRPIQNHHSRRSQSKDMLGYVIFISSYFCLHNVSLAAVYYYTSTIVLVARIAERRGSSTFHPCIQVSQPQGTYNVSINDTKPSHRSQRSRLISHELHFSSKLERVQHVSGEFKLGISGSPRRLCASCRQSQLRCFTYSGDH